MPGVEQLLDRIISFSDEKKASKIVAYNVKERSSLTEFVLIIGARNNIHCRALSENIRDEIGKYLKDVSTDDFYSPKKSGNAESGWVVLDINSIIVHIICEDIRSYYALDELYQSVSEVYHL